MAVVGGRRGMLGSAAVAVIVVAVSLVLAADAAFDYTTVYEGCFSEQPHDRYYPYSPGMYNSTGLLLNSCRRGCEQFVSNSSVASLLNGQYCFCGLTYYASAGVASDCDAAPCSDGPQCGGEAASASISVYALPTQLPLTGDVSYSSNNSLGALIYEPIEFRVYPNSSNLSSTVDFFDGSTGYSLYASDAIVNYFLYPGTFEVTSTVMDVEGNAVTGGIVLTVAVGLRFAELSCPTFAASTVTFNCTVLAIGTKLLLTIDFSDGDKRSNVSVGSSSVSVIGNDRIPAVLAIAQSAASPTAVEASPASAGVSGNCSQPLYLMANKVVSSWGFIYGWELTTVSIGELVLQIYRPTCSNSFVYCYRSDSCESSCLASTTTSSAWAEQCSASASGSLGYSLSSRGCFTTAAERALIVNSAFNRPQLTLVGETVVSVDSEGRHKIVLNDTNAIAVQPGDAVALYDPSCAVAVQPLPLSYEVSVDPGASWASRTVGSYTFPPVPSNQLNYGGMHLVTARILKTARMVLRKTYKASDRSAGSLVYNVTQTVSGTFSKDTLRSTVRIQVQDAVRNVTIAAPSYGKTNSSYSFSALTSAGTSLRYVWTFGDYSDNLGDNATTNSTMTHVYTLAGNYTITVLSFNDISSEQAQFNITIEDVVIGLSIDSSVNATEYRSVTALLFSVLQGSSVVYSIVTSDGQVGERAQLCPNGTLTPTDVAASYDDLRAFYNYTFPLIGNWTVAVNASNHVSWSFATISLPVQISIYDLIIAPPAVIPYEDTGHVDFYLVNGSHVAFQVEFNGAPAMNWSVSTYLSVPLSYTGRVYLAWSEYNRTRNHTLRVSAWNLVTGTWVDTVGTVWVDYRVQDVNTVPNTTFLRPGDPVLFNVTMRRGSRFESVITYGDGNSEVDYEEELLSDGSILFVHSYVTADNYTVVMNATNAVTACACANNTMKMIVQNPVYGTHLATNSPVVIPYQGTGLAVLTLSFDGTVLLPTDAFVLYRMGDLAVGAQSDFSHYLVFGVGSPAIDNYVYGEFGTYNVSLNVSNFVSYQFFETIIEVDQEVLNLTIVSDHTLVVFNVTVVQFTISMVWGSRVQLTWNWLDDTPAENASYAPAAVNVKSHTYAKVGVYYTQAISVNTVGTKMVSLSSPIIVQQPVAGLVLIPDKSRAVISGPLWYYTMPFHLFVTRGVPLCTNASFMVDYGDGNFSEPIDVNVAGSATRDPLKDNGTLTHVLTFTHKYYVGAIYDLNISVWNLVSSAWYTTSIKMYEALAGLHGNVTLLYNIGGSGISLNDSSVTQRPGYGDAADYFPLDMGIYIRTWCSRGVFLSYLWDYGDGNGTDLYYQIPYTTYKYSQPGIYTISLLIFNEMLSVNMSWTVRIQRRVGPANVTAPAASPINLATSFWLYPGWIGTDACYFINMIDMTSEGSYQHFVGSASTCSRFFSKQMQLGMLNTWLSEQYIFDTIAATGGYVEVDNVFRTNNIYYVKLIAINEVSSVIFYEKIAATLKYCLYPVVNVDSANPCITNDLCDTSTGKRIKKQYKGFKWFVDSSVVIECTTTTSATYLWKIYVVNETSGEETDYSGDMTKFNTPSPRQLLIPALGLDYGLYRFELNVTMFTEIGLTASDSVLVYIVRSPLVGGIVGGEFRRKGFGSNVTFDAITPSYDPDNPDDKSDFSCRWMCRRWCETWPEYSTDYSSVKKIGTSECAVHPVKGALDPTLQYSTGGCFKYSGTKSAGFFPPDIIDPADPTNCTIMQDFWAAYEGESIIMKVLIENGPRVLEVVQTVDVAYGDPPEISANCTSNCGDAVNFNAKLAYKSVIAKTRKGIEYVYSWRLLVSLNSSDYHNAEPLPEDLWAPFNTTGIASPTIALDAYTFSIADADGRTFFLEVSAYRADGNASNYGRNYKSFKINAPPTMGNCSVFPPNGSAVQTQFNTKCDVAFTDQHKPLTYMIGYALTYDPEQPNFDSFTVLAAGVNTPVIPGTGTLLAEGRVENNYIVYILIRCFDSLGAFTDLVTSVQVLPASARHVESLARSMGDGTGPIQNLIASKDSTQAFNYMGAVVSSLSNTMPDWNETEAYALCADAWSETNTTNVTSSSSGGNQTTYGDYLSECVLKQKDEYDKKVEQFAKIHEKTMQVATQMPLTTVNDGNQALSFIHAATGKPSVMSADGAANAHSVIAKSIALMQGESSQDPLARLRMCKSALGGMGNVMQAASNQQRLQNQESLAENGTASASLLQADGGSIAATSTSTTTTTTTVATTTSSTADTAASTSPSMSELGDKIWQGALQVADLVLSNIVEGEAATLLETENMAMIAHKSSADKSGDSLELSNGGAMTLNVGSSNDSIQSKVFVHRLNIAVAANETGGDQWGVTSNLVQLNLLDSSGGALKLGNASAPTHMVIGRDLSQVSVSTFVGTTVSVDSNVRMTIYKIQLPAYGSLSLRVRQYFNDTTSSDTKPASADVAAANATAAPFDNVTGTPAADNSTVATTEQPSREAVTWVLYVSLGSPPKTTDYLHSCVLPYSSDPVAELRERARLAAANASYAAELGKDVPPSWAANVPDGLAYDLDTCFVSNSLFNNTEEAYAYVGIKYIPPPASNVSTTTTTTTTTTRTTMAPSANSTSANGRNKEPSDLVFFQLEVFSSICQYMDPYLNVWVKDNCEVGPYTTPSLTHCIFYKLASEKPENWTEPGSSSSNVALSSRRKRDVSSAGSSSSAPKPMSFGAAMSVPMNSINLADSAFNHLDENPLVFSVMISIVCIYLCVLIWAKRQDLVDQLKAGSSPLLDNDPRDQYLYELVVYTGQRTRAGTTSRVSVILSGEEDETPPRLIYDDKRPVLQKGGIDAFVMATPRPLGPLTMLRVWHNNSGKSPGWLFSRMQVTDLQTGAKYFFIVNKWLAIDEDDAAIDRIVPVAGKEEMTSFNHLFWTKARKDLTDGHIWFSVFGRPHMSRFTRCQRLTVCLTLLFATMMANILFYKTDKGDASSTLFSIGTFTLTREQILTGIYSSLLVLPASIIVMQMFRKAGDRPKKLLLPKPKFEFSFLDDKEQDDVNSSRISTISSPANGAHSSSDAQKKKKKKFRLPWWIIYVAYGISFCVVAVSVWVTVEVAGVFGPEKAQRWLTSFIISFFESMLVSQPIKVVGLAVFFAMFIKKPPSEGDGEQDPELKRDETFMHQFSKGVDLTDPEYQRQFDRYREIPLPPTEEYIRAARLQRQREMEMNAVLKEIVLYAIFVSLLMMVGYGNSHVLMNFHYQNLVTVYSSGLSNEKFHPLPFTSDVMDITQVSTFDHFWNYVEDTLLIALYEHALYDGAKHEWSRNFTIDLENIRFGPVRLRQLRVVEELCPMPVYKHTKRCADEYLLNADEGLYAPGWLALNTSDSHQMALSTSAWQFRSSDELGGYPYVGLHGVYGGGGYAVDLDARYDDALATITSLRQDGWIDTLTRAVFVEFNLFNANINMNTVSFILFEFLNVGEIRPSFSMTPFRLDRYTGDFLFILLSQLLFLIYLIYFLVRECKTLAKLKLRYFKDMWNIYELVTLLACYVWVFLEIVRIAQAQSVLATYRTDKTKFVNLQWIANWNEIVVDYLGVIMFAATLKMMKLLRFNTRIVVLMKTFAGLGPSLLSFMTVFMIIFFAFANMCYMVFVNYLYSYSTFTSTCKTLLSMMLNKFNLEELMSANPLMAALMFFGFVILINFILINFMMTIIMDSFSLVKEEHMHQKNKYEMVQYIVSSFKAVVGLGKPPPGPRSLDESRGFVSNTEGELQSRIDELLDKFVGVVSSDPLQKSLLETVEQRLKESEHHAPSTARRVLTAA